MVATLSLLSLMTHDAFGVTSSAVVYFEIAPKTTSTAIAIVEIRSLEIWLGLVCLNRNLLAGSFCWFSQDDSHLHLL